MHFLTQWLDHYGYGVLFIALMLEMLALPLPGEILLSYSGLQIYEGKLSWLLSMASAGAGAIAGITAAYWIGFKLGKPFFEKYGSRFHMGPEKLAQVSDWFDKYGNKLLIISFFLPGVRHFTGYFSGVTRMPFRKYAVYAFSGALLWVGVFITLGKLLGPKWEKYHHTINRYLLIAGIAAFVVFILVYLYRKNKQLIFNRMTELLETAINHFHSLGKVKFIVLSAFALFILFFSLMIGLIQDFLAKEFTLFDELSSYLVHAVFGAGWDAWMSRFALLGSSLVFIPLIIFTLAWIIVKGKDRRLEMSFLAVVVIGGEVLDEGLRWLFHRPGPISGGFQFFNTFPSKESLTSITVCGFAAYLLVRHYGKVYIRLAAAAVVIILCLLVGISRIYYNVQYPSDVAAGYVFGGTWLSLNVILLEIFRKMKK
jgi:membrane protein DedA with SNARE-associated domain